jgi:hypothetical protein
MLEIIYYKHNSDIYLANKAMNYGNVRSTLIKSYRYNGQTLQPTFSSYWYKISGETLESVERDIPQKQLHVGYKLSEDAKNFVSPGTPEYLTVKEVGLEWDDDLEEDVWNNPKYSPIKNLYVKDYMKLPPEVEKIEFSADLLGELSIDNPLKYPEMKVNVLTDSMWSHKGTKEIDLKSVVRWEELERMLVPEFLLHLRPCHLTSKQTYEIVRNYVVENIDSKEATITSNYEFCFTVKKKIKVKPYTSSWEEKKSNGRSYSKPRIHTKKVEHKEVEVFSMTHKEKNYQGYVAIEGFKGESLEDLINNIKNYMDELMFHINEPLEECSCCGGTGHIVKSFEMNKRD